MMRRIPWANTLCLFSAAIFSAVAGMGSDTLAGAWRLTSLYRFEEARTVFARHEGREARLGEATALLNVQPRTEENINRAAALLEAVAAANPRDDLGLNARYLRARIEDVHRFDPDEERAAQLYRELREDAPPGDFMGEQASVALALLELFGTRADGPPVERLARAENLGRNLTSPAARRDFHLLLGRAWLFWDQDRARALAHFEAAWEAGVHNFANRSDTLLAIGELSRETGHEARAREAYAMFLEEFPRDDRANDVRDRLATCNAAEEARR